MRLFLVRHGQTAWNRDTRAQGHTDIPLDEEGERQSGQLGRHFGAIPLRLVYTSDLIRSRYTAEAISQATGAALIVDPNLRERSFGEWEGLTFKEVHANFERETQVSKALEICPPGGESLEQVWRRAVQFVQDHVTQGYENCAIVSHGGTCALLLAHFVGGTVSSAPSFRFSNASITELERASDGRYRLIRYNEVCHLLEDALTGDLHGSYR